MPNNQKQLLPDSLLWLQDAPLFIDGPQIERFYDAVVRPANKEGPTTLEISEENVEAVRKKLGIEATITTEKLAALLHPLFAIVKPAVKAEAARESTSQQSKGKTISIELLPISTPERQLVQLTIHYVVRYLPRFWFVRHRGAQKDWCDPASISKVPRSLVFLDLPNQDEARGGKIPETKIVPMAAEFANGKIELFFQSLHAKNGERPPTYVERTSADQDLSKNRMEYWAWFDKHYSVIQAMTVVEEAASRNGRIQWIDYRVPLTPDGETLHLHLSPASQFDTGVFAYNFIKRGFAHGLRARRYAQVWTRHERVGRLRKVICQRIWPKAHALPPLFSLTSLPYLRDNQYIAQARCSRLFITPLFQSFYL